MDLVYEICAGAVVVAGALSGAWFSTQHRDLALWGTCVVIVAVVIGFFAYWQDRLWEGDKADITARTTPVTENVLMPGGALNLPIPSIPEQFQAQIAASEFFVFLGRHLICVNDFPFVIIKQNDEPMLALDKDGDKLLLSAKFFNKDGKIICEIVNNDFHLNHNNVFRVDRASPHRLTILDDELRRVLDVDFLNPQAVQIVGEFCLRKGVEVKINSEMLQFAEGSDNKMSVARPVVFTSAAEAFAIAIDVVEEADGNRLEVDLCNGIMTDPDRSSPIHKGR